MSNRSDYSLLQALRLPVVAAPMFLVSGPELVIAQCISGIIGSMPALNARPSSQLKEWLVQIDDALDAARRAQPGRHVAPYAVNHIIHQSNIRLDEDLAICAEHKVPLVITSLRAPDGICDQVHAWGGKVFHDVTTVKHARRAIEAGADGLILVCAGAGGHAGTLSPFALLSEVRAIFDGPIVLSGAITRGEHILAAQAMGADLAYMGTRFIASTEARARDAYKQMVVQADANDILYTPYFTGVPGNYLKPSIVANGMDPDNLPVEQSAAMDFGSNSHKAWRDIWGAGQGVGSIDSILPSGEIVDQLEQEYRKAKASLYRR